MMYTDSDTGEIQESGRGLMRREGYSPLSTLLTSVSNSSSEKRDVSLDCSIGVSRFVPQPDSAWADQVSCSVVSEGEILAEQTLRPRIHRMHSALRHR
jgi:hypothetical protein